MVRELQSAVSQSGIAWIGLYTGSAWTWFNSVTGTIHASDSSDFSSPPPHSWHTLCGNFFQGWSDSVGGNKYKVGRLTNWSSFIQDVDRFNLDVCTTCLSIVLTEDFNV